MFKRLAASIKLPIVIAVVVVTAMLASMAMTQEPTSPWDFVPAKTEGTDHSFVMTDPFETPQEVTDTCLMCHPDVADHFMQTTHWTWISDVAILPGSDEPVPFGKLNSINNFCVAVPSNWGRCTQCHAGYGWKDASFDFSNPSNIDCLVCHDLSGTYKKDPKTAGMPVEGTDLLVAAQSVGMPNRANCGACHFNGGGGNNVKHGDMDTSLIDPTEDIDVHMGRNDFTCQDCHWTEGHDVSGRLPWLNPDESRSFTCSQCHGDAPHSVDRLNSHVASVACQACHIPSYAPLEQTVMHWDWSTAGLEEAPDDRPWKQKKGSFVYGTNVEPEFFWWNGKMGRYLPGEEADASAEIELSSLEGGIDDPAAKIWPFKVHRGKQPFDSQLNTILVPKLFGKDGFWKTWDWNSSLELGATASGLDYSGEYEFVDTLMYWPITHMVKPKADALHCMDCHGEKGKMPWADLGYENDPMTSGGRELAE